MIIKNGLVFQENKGFVSMDVCVENGLFSASSQDGEAIDSAGCYVIPGLIDTHFHGSVGYDLCDGTPEALDNITAYQLQNGITSICPATMTLSVEELLGICNNAKVWAEKQKEADHDNTHARLVGIYLEGPFLSQAKKGAQNGSYIIHASTEVLKSLDDASGNLVRLVAIAPETEGALEFIGKVHKASEFKNVHLSLAHTTSDYETAKAAFDAGADHVTHLYNAMPPLNHRDPGVIGAAFDAKDSYAELICDGIHINPSVVRATFAMFTDDRMVLVSDSMMAVGLEDGAYTLGGQDVTVEGKYARLADGTIAGSVTNLMDCMRTVVSMGIPLESAVKCATINPARAIGLEKELGSIEVGKIGDCVILDKDLKLVKVIKEGRPL